MKMKRAMQGEGKMLVRAIDFILIFASAGVALALFAAYQSPGVLAPLAIAPAQGSTATSSEVLFEFANAERLVIDDNREFSSPRVFELLNTNSAGLQGLEITLEPGEYYWRVEGRGRSEVRYLRVESRVELVVRKKQDIGEGQAGKGKDVYEVVNAGTTPLDVEVYEGGKLVARESVGVGGRQEIGLGNGKFKGNGQARFVGRAGEIAEKGGENAG
ncbi:hypothetical protein D6817_04135 [Candidatus Pacearchaeota archaeon]|nr:MAG: hypothetical protein D6817_04135 [Candidatus Pacearchaeota archaeon]